MAFSDEFMAMANEFLNSASARPTVFGPPPVPEEPPAQAQSAECQLLAAECQLLGAVAKAPPAVPPPLLQQQEEFAQQMLYEEERNQQWSERMAEAYRSEQPSSSGSADWYESASGSADWPPEPQQLHSSSLHSAQPPDASHQIDGFNVQDYGWDWDENDYEEDEYMEEAAAEAAAAREHKIPWKHRGPEAPSNPTQYWKKQRWRPTTQRWSRRGGQRRCWWDCFYAVSYTHLTLPTILRV